MHERIKVVKIKAQVFVFEAHDILHLHHEKMSHIDTSWIDKKCNI